MLGRNDFSLMFWVNCIVVFVFCVCRVLYRCKGKVMQFFIIIGTCVLRVYIICTLAVCVKLIF